MGSRHKNEYFDKIFNARSIALIGASTTPGKMGYIILETLLEGGYTGNVYPINPKGGELFGLPIYRSISEVPEVVDTMVVCIPSSGVPEVLLEAAKKGVRTAVIVSAGFKEAGNNELEKAIVDIARDYDFHFLGPNIQGVYAPPNKMNAAFFPALKKAGPITIIAHSGSVLAYLAEQLELENIGTRACINLGNKTNIDEADLIEYFAEDATTDAIAVYLEGIKDGRRFLAAIKKALPVKPVTVMKAGRTASGMRSASSHTGALAANDAVFDAACRQYSLFRPLTMESLFDAVKGQALIKPPKGKRIMVVSSSGGGNTLAVDAAEEYGLEIPALPQEFVERVKKEVHLPANAGVANPFDLTSFDGRLFADVIRLAEEYDIADTYVLNYADPIINDIETAVNLRNDIKSSLVVAYFGGGEKEIKGRPVLHENGIPVFATPERAATGIAAAVHYAEFRRMQGE